MKIKGLRGHHDRVEMRHIIDKDEKYGRIKDIQCEAKVSGTADSPKVTDFSVY